MPYSDNFNLLNKREEWWNNAGKAAVCLFPAGRATLRKRCHKMRVVPMSVSDIVTTLPTSAVKTLPQRCYNVATKLSIGFLGHFTMDYSDLFPFIEMWESYKSAKWH